MYVAIHMSWVFIWILSLIELWKFLTSITVGTCVRKTLCDLILDWRLYKMGTSYLILTCTRKTSYLIQNCTGQTSYLIQSCTGLCHMWYWHVLDVHHIWFRSVLGPDPGSNRQLSPVFIETNNKKKTKT